MNREVEVLSAGLAGALAALRPGGRLAVISYHSLEDRIVKRFVARESRDCIEDPLPPVCTCGHRAQLRAVTKGVVTPGPEEVRRNRRARSAKLRVAEKLAVAREHEQEGHPSEQGTNASPGQPAPDVFGSAARPSRRRLRAASEEAYWLSDQVAAIEIEEGANFEAPTSFATSSRRRATAA